MGVAMATKGKRSASGGGAALRQAFAPPALVVGTRAVDLGHGLVRVYAVAAYPPAVEAGWLAAAAALPGVTLSVHALPTDATELVLALSRAIALLAGQVQSGGTALAQQRAEQRMADAQALMRKIDAEQQSVFTVGIFLAVAAPNDATLTRRCRRMEGVLAAAGMRARVLAFRQEDGLRAAGPWATFPQALQGGAMPQVMPSETVAAAWPWSGGGVNHGRGVVLGRDSGGGLVLLDRWSPPPEAGVSNRNCTILAASGGGKSHTAKVLLLREWAQGARVVVVDPEREYRHMCRALGGAWVNVGAGGAGRINPLQAPPVPEAGDEEEGEESAPAAPIAQHLQRVRLFLDLLLPNLGQRQAAVLGHAVREVYRAAGIALDADPATIPPARWPHLGTLHAWLARQRDDEVAQGLAALLEEHAVGSTAPLWAGPSTVAADAGFVVLDIHDLESSPESVQRAQYANVLGLAWDIVRQSREERVILVVDEAWMLVDPKVPQALSFLKRMSKRIRKYSGSLVTVTQNPTDFLAPEVAREGEPVLANASTVLLLRQEGRDLPTVAGIYGLSEAEQDRLASARVGEGLLICGNGRAWVTVDTAPHETALLYAAR